MRKINFTSGQKSANFCNVLAKSNTERQNSNIYHKANSTPLACFFVRNVRTPQERHEFPENRERLSMVACNGKGSPFAVALVKQFLTPLHATAQTVRSLAVALINSHKEIAKMIYKFLLLGEKRLRISIRANSEQEARQRLQFTSPAICIARLHGGYYA